jgi:hypothetical protein
MQETPYQRSKITWPHQEKPGKKSIQIWVKVLKQTFDINGINALTLPLGPWLSSDMRQTLEWPAYYENINSLVAIADPTTGAYRQYTPTSTRHQTESFPNNAPSTALLDIASNYLPVDIHQTNHHTTIPFNRTNDKQ